MYIFYTYMYTIYIIMVDKNISYVKRLCSGSALIKIDVYESQLIQKYISCDITSACNKRYSLFFQKQNSFPARYDIPSNLHFSFARFSCIEFE